MVNTDSGVEDVSSAKAVLLGALAPGVNGPTWITLKSTFLMLGLCLAIMLGLAFSSSDSWLMFHVAFLVLITVSLFLLLSWFLAQTGFVSIENQMREMGLVQNDSQETSTKSD
ncbi:Autophagy-related protein 22-1 [Quillaja saponaria]|uniref:Autophagy-related protein 22-1 n=1 Tax=Quillaja saponaria TaxID=32244 RepID=A0AAD7PUM8_QUISA|nr:Autophagy-related protein 22-1 [Quillaja saponaria]